MSDSQFPTEIIKLPSKGLIYPSDNLLSSGELEMYYMRAKDEDILTNINFIKQEIVLDKLLQSLIVTKFNYNDLLITDKEALLLAARILGYGKEYSFNTINPVTKEYQKITIDLTEIKEREIDESIFKKGINEFLFKLPNSGVEVVFKLLTLSDDKKIDAELKGLKKINSTASYDITTLLKHIIISVGGLRDTKSIRDFIDNELLARDRKALGDYIKTITPGLELKIMYDFGTGDKEVAVPINVDFFWPES